MTARYPYLNVVTVSLTISLWSCVHVCGSDEEEPIAQFQGLKTEASDLFQSNSRDPIGSSVSGDHVTLASIEGNSECRSVLTHTQDGDPIAIVGIPSNNDGFEYEIVDQNGPVRSGKFEFAPHHIKFAVSPDGSMVVAAGRDRLHSSEVFEPKGAEIHQDGSLIRSVQNVWDFRVAPDGNAFLTVEMDEDSQSILTIVNLKEGTEFQFDLGDELVPLGMHWPHVLSFLPDSRYVPLIYGANDILDFGDYRTILFGVDGTKVTIDYQVFDWVYWESGQVGFVALNNKDCNYATVSKIRFGPKGMREVLWYQVTHEIKRIYPGDIGVFASTPWIGLRDHTSHVLDRETGETVFTFPTGVGKEHEQMSRLEHLGEVDSTVLGSASDAFLRSDRLELTRKFKPEIVD